VPSRSWRQLDTSSSFPKERKGVTPTAHREEPERVPFRDITPLFKRQVAPVGCQHAQVSQFGFKFASQATCTPGRKFAPVMHVTQSSLTLRLPLTQQGRELVEKASLRASGNLAKEWQVTAFQSSKDAQWRDACLSACLCVLLRTCLRGSLETCWVGSAVL
jgi:hypothetical protein